MIAFEGVTVRAGDTVLLNDISFTVDSGEKAIIGGPSGSGKSTALLTLMGAHALSGGRILFNGLELTAHTVKTIRKSVAFIGQEPVLVTGIVRDGLMLPFSFHANRDSWPSEEKIAEMLDRLKLPLEILARDVALISGGEKQRIAIARALLAGKNVFVADEMTSALDEESNRIVLDLFLQPDCTVLAVSHHPRWLEQFDKQVRIIAGSVVEIRKKEGRPL